MGKKPQSHNIDYSMDRDFEIFWDNIAFIENFPPNTYVKVDHFCSEQYQVVVGEKDQCSHDLLANFHGRIPYIPGRMKPLMMHAIKDYSDKTGIHSFGGSSPSHGQFGSSTIEPLNLTNLTHWGVEIDKPGIYDWAISDGKLIPHKTHKEYIVPDGAEIVIFGFRQLGDIEAVSKILPSVDGTPFPPVQLADEFLLNPLRAMWLEKPFLLSPQTVYSMRLDVRKSCFSDLRPIGQILTRRWWGEGPRAEMRFEV